MFKNRVRGLAVLLSALLLVALGFAIGTAAFPLRATTTWSPQIAENTYQVTVDTERIYSQVYNAVSPSVVSIVVSARRSNSFLPQGSGSGFVLDKLGYIATNNHVVDGADRIEVNFYDGTIVEAKVVGLDPDSDIAVIKVDLPEDRLFPVTFANSDDLFVGQHVLAIGSPFGERWTLTSGIISALNRTIDGLAGYAIGAAIQTDAAINPGNSGGTLLDLQGRVVGVNAQIYSETRSNSGVGFAIPSNLVKRVTKELIESGRVNYSYLGISSYRSNTGGDVDLDLIQQYKLPNNIRGVVVSDVVAGGPAEKAGLRPATRTSVDIITAIDGTPLTGFDALIAYLASNTLPGQQVNLTVYRDGQLINVPLTLGSRR